MNSVRYRGIDLTKSSGSRVLHLYKGSREELTVTIRLNVPERDAPYSFYFDFWTNITGMRDMVGLTGQGPGYTTLFLF